MDYVKTTVAKLPNFYATRTTTRFVGTPTVIAYDLHERLFPDVAYQRLSAIGTTSATVLYRDGQEVYADKKEEKSECSILGGGTSGEFGEILALLPGVSAHGKVEWSHWEQSAAGLQAVFRYTAVFNYKWPQHCPHESGLPQSLEEFQGEIAVNPADGSILRLTRTSHWEDDRGNLLVGKLNMMVEYGPVEIGGMTYICPMRSVTLDVGPFAWPTKNYRDSFIRRYSLSEDPEADYVNNITFAQYHLFRAEMRILPGDIPVPDATPPASTPARPAPHVPGTAPQR
jgi:hypothetical protein